MAVEYKTLQVFGSAGVSVAEGTAICTLATPGPGRFKIWGVGRHSTGDGFRLVVGSTPIVQFSMVSWSDTTLGPVVLDITNATDSIILELATATAADGSASATLQAQRLA